MLPNYDLAEVCSLVAQGSDSGMYIFIMQDEAELSIIIPFSDTTKFAVITINSQKTVLVSYNVTAAKMTFFR